MVTIDEPRAIMNIMPQSELIFAIEEEIGLPDFFVGRKKELEHLLQWTQGTKKRFPNQPQFFPVVKKEKPLWSKGSTTWYILQMFR